MGNRTEVNLKEESLEEAVRRGAAIQPGAEVGINRRVGMAVDLGKTNVESRTEVNLAEVNLGEAVQMGEAVREEAVQTEEAVREEAVQTGEAVIKEAVRMEAAMVATSPTRTGFLVRIIIIFSIITTANTIFTVVIVSIKMTVSVSVILEANCSYFVQQHKDTKVLRLDTLK